MNSSTNNKIVFYSLKGLSHELDWAFDDINGLIKARISVATGFLNFLMSLLIFRAINTFLPALLAFSKVELRFPILFEDAAIGPLLQECRIIIGQQ
jgi:hypothetical protein